MESLYFENLELIGYEKINFNLLYFITTTSKTTEFNLDAKTAILQDYLSGEILYEKE